MNHSKPELLVKYEYIGGEENRIDETFNFIINKIVEDWRFETHSHFFLQEGDTFVEIESADSSEDNSILTRRGNIIYAYL